MSLCTIYVLLSHSNSQQIQEVCEGSHLRRKLPVHVFQCFGSSAAGVNDFAWLVMCAIASLSIICHLLSHCRLQQIQEVREGSHLRRKLPVQVFQCAGSSAALVDSSTWLMRVLQ